MSSKARKPPLRPSAPSNCEMVGFHQVHLLAVGWWVFTTQASRVWVEILEKSRVCLVLVKGEKEEGCS